MPCPSLERFRRTLHRRCHAVATLQLLKRLTMKQLRCPAAGSRAIPKAARGSTRASAILPLRRSAVVAPPPYTIVITGSTKGIGKALAGEFLKHGDKVIISSRSEKRVAETVQELGALYGSINVQGQACNVGCAAEVQALADFAKKQWGCVDIWINNAGTNAYTFSPLSSNTDEELEQIVLTNVLGVMLGCREAVRVMRDQERGGHIFNMDGAGADGSPTPRFAAYGATKYSLRQLGRSLEAELLQANVRNIGVHNLSPGMVITELLMADVDTPMTKFTINCLAETADDVAAFLVPRVRRVPIDSVSPFTGAINTSYVRYLTSLKAYWQILTRMLLGIRKDRFIKE